MKALVALALTLGILGATTATANAEGKQCVSIRDVCNGGYCRTVVYDDAGGVWVSDLWKEQSK